jgi:NAD(P)H-hydrate epimerase
MIGSSFRFSDVITQLKKRESNSHKGDYGRILIIGGDIGMGGAGILASEAALMSGGGLVTLASQKETIKPSLLRAPEVMTQDVSTPKDLSRCLDQKDTILCGVGFSHSSWSKEALGITLQFCEKHDGNLIIDGGALRILDKNYLLKRNMPSKTILTPHPGEAAALLNLDCEEIQKDRINSAIKIRDKYNAYTILKGNKTIIAGEAVYVCDEGGPELAIPGSGDVLAGILAGLISNQTDAELACKIAVSSHGIAGEDFLNKVGQIGLKSSELIEYIRLRINT